MEEAEKLCTKIGIIDHGKIIAHDTTEKLRETVEGDLVVLEGKNILTEELRKIPFIKKITVVNKHVELTVTDAAKNLQQLLVTIGSIDFIEVHPPDLNDVFLYYTGKQIRETEGGTMEHFRSITRARQTK